MPPRPELGSGSSPLTLRPGALVVLEGLDGGGKSTQRDILSQLAWAPPGPRFMHMPSGMTELTQAIYEVTERNRIESLLARQLLHLACHAENRPHLEDARSRSGVILDRWWWSTVAYGWFGGLDAVVPNERFFGAVEMVWSGLEADVVFLFAASHTDDRKNSDAILCGYRWLAERQPDIAVQVPDGDIPSVTAFILDELDRRGLLEVNPTGGADPSSTSSI